MKTITLIAVLIMFPVLLCGQDIKADSTKFTYCELVGHGRLLSNKVTVEIDFGQLQKFFSIKRYKDPETGKQVVFNSMVDALNFMGADNWEFVQAYIVTEGVESTIQNVYHFLLKKRTFQIEN